MRCPTGRHGAPLRFHIGTSVHITYHDLGNCPESETHKWLTGQGIPAGCLKRPKDWPDLGRSPKPGSDAALADAILDVAFGEGTPTERLIRCVVLAIDGEIPEGVMVDVLADRLRLKPRIIYQATAEMRRKGAGLRPGALREYVPPPGEGGNTVVPEASPELSSPAGHQPLSDCMLVQSSACTCNPGYSRPSRCACTCTPAKRTG